MSIKCHDQNSGYSEKDKKFFDSVLQYYETQVRVVTSDYKCYVGENFSKINFPFGALTL